jgi:tetratricopeptide (TPR) repeat protein
VWKGEFGESRLLLEEGLQVGNDLGAGLYGYYQFSQRSLGLVMAHLGRYKEACVHLRRALALAQEAENRWVIGITFHSLGLVALAEGNYVEARRILQKGLAVMQEMGQRANVGWFLAALAGAERGLGQLSEAQELLHEALRLSGAMRDTLTPLHVLPVAALLLADWGDIEQAVEIYALASRFGFVANSRLWEDIAGRHIAAAAATLSPEVVAATQERGRARDLWATVKELLDE